MNAPPFYRRKLIGVFLLWLGCLAAEEKLNTYEVQKGDYLFKIAREQNLTTQELKALNPKVDFSQIQPGDQIVLSKTPKAKSTPDDAKTYTIKDNDTFFSIARELKTTVRTLRLLNPEVKPSSILEGDKIRIP